MYEGIISPKSFVHRRWGKSLLVCQREEGDPNDVYTVAVKTDATKTVQSKRNNDLLSLQLHLIIDFVLTIDPAMFLSEMCLANCTTLLHSLSR